MIFALAASYGMFVDEQVPHKLDEIDQGLDRAASKPSTTDVKNAKSKVSIVSVAW